MQTKLLALHGFSLSGSVMKTELGALHDAISPHLDLVYPDAPHTCTPGSVERLYALWKSEPRPPPHRCWWDANADGSIYEGWEETREFLRELLIEHEPVGVLGFSQGAMVAATVAALAHAGELPKIRFVILIAGGVPRAEAIRPYFTESIVLPSLHIWGTRDLLSKMGAPLLVERFTATDREVVLWPGPHQIPTEGEPAEALVHFIRRHG